MRKWINIIDEASMPFGRMGDLTGFKFGFESEFVGRLGGFTNPVDIGDWSEQQIVSDLGLDEDDFNNAFAEWSEDHPDGDVYDWINDVGLEEWWKEVDAPETQYTIKDGELVEFLPWENIADELSELFREEFGDELNVATGEEKQIPHKNYDEWYLETDASVGGTDSDWDHAFEIVSPAFASYDEFAENLRHWLTWFPSYFDGDLYTNKTTGLHINISAAGAQIDPLKLLLFSGEKWMTQHWRGKGNGYTGEILPRLVDGLPASIQDAREFTQKFIEGLNEKSFAVNLLTLISRGYVEFRPIGNEGYETRIDEIFQHISRFVQLIKIASDPQLYRKEYAKKLGQLLIGKETTPVLNTDQRIVTNWMANHRFTEYDRNKIMTADGQFTIEPAFLFEIVGLLRQDQKPIPDMVVKVLARQAGLNPQKYAQICAQYDEKLPWPLRDETYHYARKQLDRILGQPK